MCMQSLRDMVFAVQRWLFYTVEIENLVVTQFIRRIPQQFHSGMEDPEDPGVPLAFCPWWKPKAEF